MNYCVIGSPVAHSLSPAIHTKLYEIYGIDDCAYTVRETRADGLPDFIASARSGSYDGFNVTMPLKPEIIPYLDAVGGSITNSVNTVTARDGVLTGYSTDQPGFYRALVQAGGDYAGRNIVFIGCGAVARGLIADAAEKGARSITVLNRTLENAQAVRDDYGAAIDTPGNISRYTDGCDILINTTPLGMGGNKADFEDLSFMNLLPAHALVCDLIYSPPVTRFLAAAQSAGLKTQNGLPMLIWQAFFAFEIFLGILPNERDYGEVMKTLV